MTLYASAYARVLQNLGLPQYLSRFLSGEVACPNSGLRPCDGNWGFPPALIPIWVDLDLRSYYGIWQHWFGDRSVSFVRADYANRCKVVEVARTPEQFGLLFAFFRVFADDGLSEVVRSFSSILGPIDCDLLLRIAEEKGETADALAGHPSFKGTTPLLMHEDAATYTGEFPVMKNGQVACSIPISHTCSLDYDDPTLEAARRLPVCPEWLMAETDKKTLFERMLQAGDYDSAWFCLNSSSWRRCDIANALRELARISDDEALPLLAESWEASNGPEFLSY